MSEYKIGNVIKLKNNTFYRIISSIIYEGDNILYLINEETPVIHLIGVVEKIGSNDKINIIDTNDMSNKKELEKIIKLLKEEARKFIGDDRNAKI